MTVKMNIYECLLLLMLFQVTVSCNVHVYERIYWRYPEVTNATSSNDTLTIEGHHKYYNSTFYSDPNVAKSYWVDLNKVPKDKVFTMLLTTRIPVVQEVKLSFQFPYYGHTLDRLWVDTSGVIHTAEPLWRRYSEEYIAPLWIYNYQERSNSSQIQFYDNGTALVVQWQNFQLYRKVGNFTFQATLLQNGDMIFVYKEIAYPLGTRVVTVGCIDSFRYEIEDRIFIFIYHRVELRDRGITNNTAIYLIALPTCLQYTDCDSCVNANIGFNCSWCNAIGKCSDGISRHRQKWISKGCHEEGNYVCSAPASPRTVTVESTLTIESDLNIENDHNNCGIGAAAIFGIFLFINLVVAFMLWLCYGYMHPQSSSGQLLIKYRPSKWKL